MNTATTRLPANRTEHRPLHPVHRDTSMVPLIYVDAGTDPDRYIGTSTRAILAA